jgi:L-asparagine oxygenase
METGMSLIELSYEERFGSPLSSAGPTHAASGSEPAERAVLWLTVGDQASDAFARMTEGMRAAAVGRDGDKPGPDQDPSAWLESGVSALEQAAAPLVRSLRQAASQACPVIVVRGLPVESVPPATPYDGIVDPAASFQAIMNLHAVVASFGLHPVVYARENTSILHAVCPVAGALGQLSSHGFDAALPFHSDYADRPIDEPVRDQSPAAAALVFAVERADPSVPMQCVLTRTLLSRLSPRQIEIGRSDEFAVTAPDLFGGGQLPRIRRLFLAGRGHGVRCRLNLGKMTGRTGRAARLLREIHDILSDESLVETIDVRRGDLVIMDNQRAIHRRAAFTPRWDGTDRYFIRMSAAPDPRAGLASDPLRPWVWS